jgi:hypothetical protein
LCGDFGRAYVAPGGHGQTNPAAPPEGLGEVNAIDSRAIREGETFKSYTVEDQQLIRSGRARVGLDELALYLANGQPAFYWNTNIDETRCRILLYGVLGHEEVDTAVYTCNGNITHIGPVQPRLPCWRLEEVAPRAIERAQHFDAAQVDRQWEILHGLLQRGQSVDDVYIAFGEPYRTGSEAREDGTDALQHVYLDGSADAYALYLTFVDRSLRGWRFPPDRQLTPEAQQRRLDAMEQRMVDQMNEIERQSIARHQAEMQHLNVIQDNQAQIRTDIANARTAVIDTVQAEGAATRGVVREEGAATREEVQVSQQQAPPESPGGGGGGASGGGPPPVPRGCQRLVFNGRRFSDRHGTPMNTRCGGEHGACPAGYICLGTLNRCMPEDGERCH